MDTIKIGFSRPRKFFVPFSWLIRLVDGTPYSHTYIKIYSAKYDRWLIYQASSLMVNFMGQDCFNQEAMVIREFSINVSDETRTSVMQFAIDNAGDPYDLKSVFGIVVVKIAALFGKKMANPFGNRKGQFFCSELVADIMIEKLGDKLDGNPNDLTPRDIYQYLEKGI